jgi:hypothetical protein
MADYEYDTGTFIEKKRHMLVALAGWSGFIQED